MTWIGYSAAVVLGMRWNEKTHGVHINGVGMDMTWYIVHLLGEKLGVELRREIL